MLARTTAKNLGLPDFPVVIASHPVGDLEAPEVIKKADKLIDAIVRLVS